MDFNNNYTKMQQNVYDQYATEWSLENRNPVVGSFDQHNAWLDYQIYLFNNISTYDKVALDFGCGPGRGIVQFAHRFKYIDGVDLSNINLNNAKLWCEANHLSFIPTLYKSNGIDLSNIESEKYDIVYSTICLQHICVHEIRLNIFKEMFRVLKYNGYICIQMGFGEGHPKTAKYYDNCYDAENTNSYQDVQIMDTNQIKNDLESIGFKNFEFDLRPTGPGDCHGQWIFFRMQK